MQSKTNHFVFLFTRLFYSRQSFSRATISGKFRKTLSQTYMWIADGTNYHIMRQASCYRKEGQRYYEFDNIWLEMGHHKGPAIKGYSELWYVTITLSNFKTSRNTKGWWWIKDCYNLISSEPRRGGKLIKLHGSSTGATEQKHVKLRKVN